MGKKKKKIIAEKKMSIAQIKEMSESLKKKKK